MPLSPESIGEAERNPDIGRLRELKDSSPSAGDFSLCFAQSVALILHREKSPSNRRREIIRLSALVKERPFPAMPLALAILKHLDDTEWVEDVVEMYLEDKRRVRQQLADAAATDYERIGLRANAKVLVFGHSYMFPILFHGLPDAIKQTLQISAPQCVRRRVNEGEYLKRLIEEDPTLRGRVCVLDDADVLRALHEGAFDTLVMSSKAVGLYNGRLSTINMYSKEDLVVQARANGLKTLVVSARYKIWPQDLFSLYASNVLQDERRFDAVVDEGLISWFLTELGAFPPAEFQHVYRAPLTTNMASYPGFWFSEPETQGSVHDHADSGSPQRLLEDLSAKIDKMGESFDRRLGRIEGCLGIDASAPDIPLRDADILTVQFEHEDRNFPYGLLDEAGYWYERLLYGCVRVESAALDFLERKNVKYIPIGDYAQLLSTERGANELRDKHVERLLAEYEIDPNDFR